MPRSIIDLALHLHAGGYEVVACCGKVPVFGQWQRAAVTEDTIRSWASNPNVTNIGIRTGTVIGLDIDILDAGLSERVKNLALQVLGDTGLIRVGKSPKQLMGYRLAQPMRKRIFAGERGGVVHKVEVLGEGQQFVAYGPYPGTLRKYEWPERSLYTVPANELPLTTPEALDAFGAALADIIGPPPQRAPVAPAAPARPYLNGSQPENDKAEALEALATIPPDIEYGEWVRVAMALQAVFGDAGLYHWDFWSSKGTKYKPGECSRKWPSIRQNRSIHRETLFQIAKDRGGYRPDAKGERVESLGIFQPATPRHDPETGEILEDEPAAAAGRDTPRDTPLSFTPYIWIDPERIPPRAFLYGGHYIRQFLSVDVAPGGIGKSSLVIAEALAMAAHKDILGTFPTEKIKVAYWNGEDPMEELQRRVQAVAAHYDIDASDIEGRLFIDSGRLLPLILATEGRGGVVLDQAVIAAIIASIKASDIDVLIVDPFIATHRVGENDNNAIELVAKTWSHIADVTRCSVNLVHHSRKLNGEENTVESGRGASALLAACRSARALNQMTKDEAAKVGVTNHRLYFRVDDGKANLQPPAEKAAWHQLVNVDLPNGPMGTTGDKVGVVAPWELPDAMGGLTAADLRRVQSAVGTGKWRANIQARDWVGRAVAQALNLALPEEASRVKALIAIWMKSGALTIVTGLDEKRRERDFVEVGNWVEDDS